MNRKGKVFLVGAGPGDFGLITVRGLELVKAADVIVYDQLGTAEFLRLCRPGCEMIDVGKFAGNHTIPQHETNKILVNKALENKMVVRLKGGDPFVFGRGGEELQELHEAGIRFEVVPGITSAISAPAYAGIPVTHRDCTSTMAIITGHEADKGTSAIDWQALSKIGTLIFLMGVKKLPGIVKNLIDCGKSPETPIALVQHGTLPIQKTVTATLATIVETVAQHNIKAPAVTIIGDVVNLRASLKWFEARPLSGKTILVTRSRHQASSLISELKELGANAIECPTIKIVQHQDSDKFKSFFKRINEFNYLVFTSVNGVTGFIEALLNCDSDLRCLAGKKIVCIGPATAEAFSSRGIKPDFVPETYVAESLLPFFERSAKGAVAILRAEKAREILPDSLKKAGFEVEVVPLYHTEYDKPDFEKIKDMLTSSEVDLVTFTSSSTVEGFVKLLSDTNIEPSSINAAVIGPITRETAEKYGFTIATAANEYTIAGLVEAIIEHCKNGKTS